MSPAGPGRIRALADSHLLLLDPELEPQDVLSLYRNLRPHLPAGEPVPGEHIARTYRITRHSQLVGPFAVDRALRASLSLPPETVGLFALEAPRDREPVPPPEWLADPDGLHECFPRGLPAQEEGRVLDELIAVARRLRLVVRAADEPQVEAEAVPRVSGGAGEPRFIRPATELTPNLFVYSEYWLDPQVLLARVARAAPQVRMPRPPAVSAQRGPDGEAHSDDPVVLDGYAVEVPLEGVLGERAGLIEIQVMLERQLPAIVRAHTEGDLIAYVLRWDDADGVGRLPTADPEFARLRQQAITVLERCAREIMEAVGGVGVDESGFLVSAAQLGD